MERGRELALTGGAWVAVGLASGVQIHLVSGLGTAPVALGHALRLQVLAAVPWIPATFAALALAALRPVTRPRRVARLALHLAAALAAVLALNLAITALQGLAVPGGAPAPGLLERTIRGVMAEGHLALLVWGGLVAAGHARTLRTPKDELGPGSTGGQEAPPSGAGAEARSAAVPGSPAPGPLSLRDHRGTVLLPPAVIRWIQADGDYARVHARDGSEHVVSARMADLERWLEPHGFARAHRSAIVNLARVRRHYPRSHGDHVLELDDGARVPLPRGRRRGVLERLPGSGPAGGS